MQITEFYSKYLQKNEEYECYSDVGFGKICTFHTGGTIKLLVYPRTVYALVYLIKTCVKSETEYKVVGFCSNILPPSECNDTVIICTRKLNGIKYGVGSVVAECGMSLSLLIKNMVGRNMGGIENLYGIPASVGGAVRMNSGAFGEQISDILKYTICLNLTDFTVKEYSREDMRFSYRHSRLCEGQDILLEAGFRPVLGVSDAAERAKCALERKRSSQPCDMHSAGSVFLRMGDGFPPTAKIIDMLGLKGKYVRSACVSKKHSGFIVNSGDATPKDILRLIEYVSYRIKKETGVRPKCEIEIMEK